MATGICSINPFIDATPENWPAARRPAVVTIETSSISAVTTTCFHDGHDRKPPGWVGKANPSRPNLVSRGYPRTNKQGTPQQRPSNRSSRSGQGSTWTAATSTSSSRAWPIKRQQDGLPAGGSRRISMNSEAPPAKACSSQSGPRMSGALPIQFDPARA